MAKVRNTVKLINEFDKHANVNYDIFTTNINDIYKNSENSFNRIVDGFKFGYMQGMKATKAELRKRGACHE